MTHIFSGLTIAQETKDGNQVSGKQAEPVITSEKGSSNQKASISP